MMQVPALVLDCEPNIDFNRDIEAKRQYVNFSLFSIIVYLNSLSLNSIPAAGYHLLVTNL